MLTKKQLELLSFIHARVNETGVPPSFDEMKDALQLASKSGIHRLVTALEERGYIRRLANRARAVEIVRMPDIMPAPRAAPSARPKAANDVASGGGARELGITVPVMGRIAAGSPISAIEQPTGDVIVSPDLIAGGEHYGLEVRGDSMVGIGILDGDTVIIRKTENARSGDVVVALIDDEEATLKTLRRESGKIALEAANPAYETRVFEPGRVKVQGQLAGLVRRYH